MGVDDELERLRDELERLGAPIVRYLRPGVATPEAAAARVRDATGLDLPPDAAAWFSWQGGVDQHDPALAPHSLAGWELFGLEEAISKYRSWLWTTETPPDADVQRWDARWFPLSQDSGGTPLMVVCGGERDGQIHVIHYDDVLIGHTYPSFARVVAVWVSFLRDGIWDYDHQAGRWIRDSLRLRGDDRFGLA